MKQIFKMLQAVISLSILLLLAGCIKVETVEPRDFPVTMMITVKDLPDEWKRSGGSFEDIPDSIISHIEGYIYREGDNGQVLSQQLTIYPDTESAITGYASWESRWFPTDKWQTPESTTLVPMDNSDLVRFNCINLTINDQPVQSCKYLHQYKQLISYIMINVDNVSITFSQAEELIRVLDKRMEEYDGPLPMITPVVTDGE